MKCDVCDFKCTEKNELNNHIAQTRENEVDIQQSVSRKRVKFTFKCLKKKCDSTFDDNYKLGNHDFSQHDSVKLDSITLDTVENESPP